MSESYGGWKKIERHDEVEPPGPDDGIEVEKLDDSDRYRTPDVRGGDMKTER